MTQTRLICIILLIMVFAGCTKPIEKIVRQPAYAGSWYPADQEELSSTVKGYLNNVKKVDLNGTIKAIIVPHAGYVYSGQVAAVAFSQLEDVYKTIFILGPSHKQYLQNAAVSGFTHFATPLGELRVSEKKLPGINTNQEAHAQEHSIEIELPFLQEKLSDFEILPIMVGSMNISELKTSILSQLEGNDLIVVSVDLSHYHGYEEALKLDAYSINSIVNLDSAALLKAEIDAPWAVGALIEIAKEKGWKPTLLYYANSGDVSGDKTSVVGYSAIVFVDERKLQKNELLSAEEQDYLLKLARTTLEQYLKDGKRPEIKETDLTPALKKVQGCFTTLNKDNNLRGCIGHILPQEELYKCIMDNAVSAAVHDRRFIPVKYSELKDIKIEISVLTVPQKLDLTGEELKNDLKPLVDGVVLRNGDRSSTYLPQVWEQLPDKELFLSELCVKGNMPTDCWSDPSTEVYTYQAFVFEED